MAGVINTQFASEVKTLPNDIDEMLKFCTQRKCSDLFIKVGEPPYVYQYGIMYRGQRIVDTITWNKFANKAITSEMNAVYVRTKMLDFQYTVGDYRYRVNASYSQRANMATFRMMTERLPTFDSLGIDKNVSSLLTKAFSAKQGIVMLVGATSSGKSSTLAACVNTFTNSTIGGRDTPLRDGHLITLEDPIEYIFPSTQSTLIHQKELESDFKSYELGIKSALREHPTALLIQEVRSSDTIKTLIEAVVTGHLCVTTFHSQTVATAIARLYSHLFRENQDVMFDLIRCFNFIIAQELIKGRGGYTLNYQYLFLNETIKQYLIKAIYDGKNIPDTVDNLFKNKKLIDSGLASDWKYPHK